jgi:hypothetical protein
LLKIASCLFI